MASYSSLLPTAARGILSSCRPALRPAPMATFLPGLQQVRAASQARKKDQKASKKKKGPREFKQKDLKDMQQYALCDAMRYA